VTGEDDGVLAGTVAAALTGADTSNGLDSREVAERVKAGLVNKAPPAPGRSTAQILRANVFTRFNAILGTLFVIVVVVGPPQDALFGVVLVVNTGVGVFQEMRAKRALDRLAILTAPRARVLRDGRVSAIGTGDLVQDDVLELRIGDQVAVDAAVLAADGLEIDEALLTGEAESVAKQPGDSLLSGSFVVAGSGRARATAVGGQAYAARLQADARRFSLIHSELQQGTTQILRGLTWVMIPAGALLLFSEFFRSHDTFEDAVRGSAAGLVAMVPEGLVLLTSLAFAMGAMRLAQRRVLVQELAAIEGLARTDVLCIDKTGTLTRPGMRLIETEVLDGWSTARIAEVVAALAADDEAPNGTVAALAAHYPDSPGWTVTARVPFSSARKWSGLSFAGQGSWLLGAPAIVGPNLQPAASAAVARHEAAGRRVLLLAERDGSLDGEPAGGGPRGAAPATAGAPLAGAPPDAEPAALLVLAEELRDETAATVRYLLDQGVTIRVLSGDAPRAVAAIARRAGIPAEGEPCDASRLTEDEMAARVGSVSVFGRVRPGQKLAAVRALRQEGHVVAMVGDGVNDVQALKEADLGIAMGSGSQASRSVARVVLLDGTFAAVPQILGEGRRVIANIERVARLFVTKTAYAALIAIAVGVAGAGYPFYPRHLTIISTLTIGVPGFFLALAPGAPRARPGFVRRVLDFAVPAGVAVAAAVLVTYAIAHAMSVSQQQVRTACLLAAFAMGLWILALITLPRPAPADVSAEAGWPVSARLLLVVAMAACLAALLAIPLARTTFALQLPPPSLLAAEAVVVLVAIIALALWRGPAVRLIRSAR
jgi:cation-transporting P-type ATPase E